MYYLSLSKSLCLSLCLSLSLSLSLFLPEIPGTHQINIGKAKDLDDLEVIQWF